MKQNVKWVFAMLAFTMLLCAFSVMAYGEQEKRKHGDHHDNGCGRGSGAPPEQKE